MFQDNKDIEEESKKSKINCPLYLFYDHQCSFYGNERQDKESLMSFDKIAAAVANKYEINDKIMCEI